MRRHGRGFRKRSAADPGGMAQAQPIPRTGTFFVEANAQQRNLANLRRENQQLAESYHRSKPLCFSAGTYQLTHPVKAMRGRKDADAALLTPCVLGVADGVSQIEDFGIDAAELPQELLSRCKALAEQQLRPGSPDGAYRGPTSLVRQAYQETAPILGSTTLVLAVLDNKTFMHGKLHPMIAVISIGDCELVVLRRLQGEDSRLTTVFKTEMQRIDGNVGTPLQLARVDARIDPSFHDGITVEVIEKGSAVSCVSAYEGDIVIMGSDGVFDNLYTSEVADIVNAVLSPGTSYPVESSKLSFLARQIVEACHLKTKPQPDGRMPDAPIGPGGKADDTACVVAEVVELELRSGGHWGPLSQSRASVHERDDHHEGASFWGCGVSCTTADHEDFDGEWGACGVGAPKSRRGRGRGRRPPSPPPPESDESSSDGSDGAPEDNDRGGCCVA